jgi:hypothetical protein
MTDISAFPAITQVCDQGQRNSRAFKVGATAVKAGMAVAYAATGVDDVIVPALQGTTGSLVGVAANDAAIGAWVNVYIDGATVYVANADSATGIDAGDLVEYNDNAVGGTVSTKVQATTPATGTTLINNVLGYAVEDIAGGATGRVMIHLQSLQGGSP